MHATFAKRQAIDNADFFSPSKQVAHLRERKKRKKEKGEAHGEKREREEKKGGIKKNEKK